MISILLWCSRANRYYGSQLEWLLRHSNIITFRSTSWLGVLDYNLEGQFLCASSERISYTNWGPEQPDNNVRSYFCFLWLLGSNLFILFMGFCDHRVLKCFEIRCRDADNNANFFLGRWYWEKRSWFRGHQTQPCSSWPRQLVGSGSHGLPNGVQALICLWIRLLTMISMIVL